MPKTLLRPNVQGAVTDFFQFISLIHHCFPSQCDSLSQVNIHIYITVEKNQPPLGYFLGVMAKIFLCWHAHLTIYITVEKNQPPCTVKHIFNKEAYASNNLHRHPLRRYLIKVAQNYLQTTLTR